MNPKKVQEISIRRGFFIPTAEIYGGLAGFFDYGHLGTVLKRKLINYWLDFFVKSEENIYELDSSIILPRKVFEASGHLKSFVDPITQCKKCKTIHRADNLIEDVLRIHAEGLSEKELTKIIEEKNVKCPKCKGKLSEVRVFNLMLKTFVGPTSDLEAYLRPETAQGIFINFKRIVASLNPKLPFGVAQVGLSFRNEISPRRFLTRLRCFHQMEIEYFVHPDKLNECESFEKFKDVKLRILTREAQKSGDKEIEITAEKAVEQKLIPNKAMTYFMAKEMVFYQSLGIPFEAIRFRHMLPEETPHYSKGNFDLEIKFDFGWKEVVGNAYRTDYDLKNHMEKSGEDLHFVLDDGTKVIPHVIEPSFGVERTIYAMLLYCLREDKERGWDWFALPAKISPYVAAVFPLVNKNGLPEKAKEVYKNLKECFDVFYNDKGSIGKRYAKADEIGVPFCITIDHQTLQDHTVTVRDRDTTKQERIKIKDLKMYIWEKVHKR